MNRVNELLDVLTAIQSGEPGTTLEDAFALLEGAREDAADAERTMQSIGILITQYERGGAA